MGLAESGVVGAGGSGVADCAAGLAPVLGEASGHDWEKEADEKTI